MNRLRARFAVAGVATLFLRTASATAVTPPATLASFDDGIPGSVAGEVVPASPARCDAAAVGRSADAAAGVLLVPSGLDPAAGAGSALRLSTSGSDDEGLAQARWELSFETDQPVAVDLAFRFATADRQDFGDAFVILLDGRVVACGDAADGSLQPAPDLGDDWRATPWRSLLRSGGDSRVEPGTHVLEVAVTDGVDSAGESILLLDAVRLVAASAVPTPCRPAPPEDVNEIRDPSSDPTVWTFDDNRFCAAGPQLGCSRPGTDPNPDGFSDATGQYFEMYVVADCGTEMHVPLDDVESGCVSILDRSRNPILINVTNNFGFDETGLEVCWNAEFCDGQGMNAPGGPGNERTMDVSFAGSPTLCGVFIVRFGSWAGCIWDLFANCTGTNTPAFDIYDDLCLADMAVNPLPELVVQDLVTSDGGGCTVDYCVDARNIGCDLVGSSVVRVSNGVGPGHVNDHPVTLLGAGETEQFCGTLTVDATGPLVTTVVTARADATNVLLECSESPDASSCSPGTGGNSVSRAQVVSCVDPPSCDAGGPYTATCASGTGATLVPVTGAGSSDPDGEPLTYAWTTNCPGGNFDDPTAESPILSIADGGCFTCQVFLAVTDASGQSDTCSSDVTLTDDEAPTVTCPPDTASECPSGAAAQQAWFDLASGFDSCAGALVPTRNLLFSNSPCPGAVSEIWQFVADDGCGQQATCQARWDVLDTQPPLVTPPADRTVECGMVGPGDLTAWLDSATATDACAGAVDVTNQLVSTMTPCLGSSIRRYVFQAIDGCGNPGQAFATYTIRDTTPPDLQGVPPDTTVDCSTVPGEPRVLAIDRCVGVVPVTSDTTRADGPCPDTYTLTRTWTATDECGNTATAAQVVTVRDLTPPALSGVPPSTTVECDDLPGAPTVTATDTCDPDPGVAFDETRTDGPCPDAYTLTRTWTATDRCGNATSASQVVTVRDTMPPTLAGVPADETVECDAVPAAATPSASDRCDPDPPVTLAEVRTDGPCPDSYTLARTWTATDRCGNAASAIQVLTVRDTVAPVLANVPADVTVACDAVPAAGAPSAADTCDPSPAIAFAEVRTDGPCPDTYVLTRTWTATDRCGNTASASQAVSVRDVSQPTLVGVPADTTVECDAVPAPAAPSAVDACDPDPAVFFLEQRIDGPCDDTHALVRTWTAIDRCGNAASQAQVVSVRDTMPPALSGVPADVTVECDAVPGPATPSAADACDPSPAVAFDEVRADGPCQDTYVLTRTWTATDRCANAASATQVVTVRDTRPPALSGVPADETVECDAVPPAATPSASDNCDPLPAIGFDEQRADGPCPATYALTRTWTTTDRCGNSSSQVQVVSVVDTTPPQLFPPDDLTVECPAPTSGPQSEAEWLATLSATDNCGPATTRSRLVEDRDECGDTFTHVWELWAVDECGNEAARVRRTYRVVDTTPPQFREAGAQFDLSIWPPNHGYVVFATADLVSASDACGGVDVRASGCSSSQPEEVHQGPTDDGGNGDGHTYEDCVVSLDGAQFAVRAERLGACGRDSARVYGVQFTATDECGNAAPGEGLVRVEHDRSGHQPHRIGRKLGPNDPPPFPYLHPTVYGRGCGEVSRGGGRH
jgi:hypothetical protein